MKKTAICLLLALVMVFSLVLAAAPAAQAAEHTDHCICGGTSSGVGDHTCANVTWTAWTDVTTLPTASGYYYLTNDVTYAESITDPKDVVLCLNGHNVTCTNQSAFWLEANSSLTICDCSANGADGVYTFGGTVTGNSIEGGCIYNENSGIRLNIYGGNFKAPANVTTGGVIYCAGGILNIYNGIFEGGAAENRGGTLNIAGSEERTVCNMYGGIVRNGSNTHSTLGGGNIRIGGGNLGTITSEFNLYGGLIENGTSTSVGGNIFVQQPYNCLNIYGGTIANGSAATEKNIYATFGATVKVFKLDASTTITKGSADVTIDLSELDKSFTFTENNGVYTLSNGIDPDDEPIIEPTEAPTAEPTEEPTAAPTVEPAEDGTDSNGLPVIVIVIIAMAALAAVCGIFVLAKKRKA